MNVKQTHAPHRPRRNWLPPRTGFGAYGAAADRPQLPKRPDWLGIRCHQVLLSSPCTAGGAARHGLMA